MITLLVVMLLKVVAKLSTPVSSIINTGFYTHNLQLAKFNYLTYDCGTLGRRTIKIILAKAQFSIWQLSWVGVDAEVELHVVSGSVAEHNFFALTLLELEW